jgi:hypothetical protein
MLMDYIIPTGKSEIVGACTERGRKDKFTQNIVGKAERKTLTEDLVINGEKLKWSLKLTCHLAQGRKQRTLFHGYIYLVILFVCLFVSIE